MSVQVSLCHIRFEIDLEQNMMNAAAEDDAGAMSVEHPTNPRVVREHRGKRNPHKITIESYKNNSIDLANESKGILPQASREQTPQVEDAVLTPSNDSEDINFFSGNPFVEVTKGIIHLYKKNERTAIKEGGSKTLCLIAVPANLNCHDLLKFIAPCQSVIQHVRIIRDGSPNQFMVLLEFRSFDAAIEFYEITNGIPFNSLEPDNLCHAVWVSSVEWGLDGTPPLNHTELPMCPVCLERMDESIDGVLTILCNHAFHASCLIKWGDSTCPVCRCVQTPEMTETSLCMECEGSDSLWICLICGHVGCGRYQGGHAASHYRSTNHTYALQLGTNRVWDYAGDNFVHRLLQSKTDGKLVQTQSPDGGDGEEKIDSMQLEFTYLLTSQLDAQREYYEEKLNRLELFIEKENTEIRSQTATVAQKNKTLESKMKDLLKDKVSLEKKVLQLQTKLTAVTKELSEERQVGKALRSNQAEWQVKYQQIEKRYNSGTQEKEAEIAELKEQIRDLMFYMEAQNFIEQSDLKDEIASGSVIVPETAAGQSTSSTSATHGSSAEKIKAKLNRKKKK